MSDILVTTSGCTKPIKPMNGKYYALHELQNYVGGYIETVPIADKLLIVDEEGKLKGKAVNMIATGWLQQQGICDFICGAAILIDPKHLEK